MRTKPERSYQKHQMERSYVVGGSEAQSIGVGMCQGSRKWIAKGMNDVQKLRALI